MNDLSPAVIVDDLYSLEKVQNNIIIWDVCTCSIHGLLHIVTDLCACDRNSEIRDTFTTSTLLQCLNLSYTTCGGNDYLNFHV